VTQNIFTSVREIHTNQSGFRSERKGALSRTGFLVVSVGGSNAPPADVSCGFFLTTMIRRELDALHLVSAACRGWGLTPKIAKALDRRSDRVGELRR